MIRGKKGIKPKINITSNICNAAYNKNLTPLEIYNVLYNNFGSQGWWPVTRKGKIYPEYLPHYFKRNNEKHVFEICLGAILTQNTAWKNVEKAISNLHRTGTNTIKKILDSGDSKIAELIKPSGYYNQKAKRITQFSKYFLDKYKGRFLKFFEKPLAENRKELMSINGIGPETADSILLYAGNKKIFVVDAYTKRLGLKFGWFKTDDYDEIQRFFQENLPSSSRVYNEYHALIVTLAKQFCRILPMCNHCPINIKCGYKKVSKNESGRNN